MSDRFCVEAKINDRWDIALTEDRARFHADRPGWEAERLDAMSEIVEWDDVIFDVGAESGDFSALYRTWAPEGELVLVEPQTRYWPQIRQHFDANCSGVPLYCFSGFAGRATITPEHDTDIDRYGVSEGWPDAVEGDIAPDPGFLHLTSYPDGKAPQLRLDVLSARLNVTPDHVVMDIEGAECDAFFGSVGLLALGQTHFWISVHEPTMLDWYKHTLDELLELAVRYRYAPAYLGSHGGEDFWRFLAPSPRMGPRAR